MSDTVQIIVTIICSFAASSGFWAYISQRSNKKDLKYKVLIGIAHDRIMYLGKSFIKRGSITADEYENLHDYLYAPYKQLGGNGSAERIMKEVDKLEIKQ